MLVTKTMVVGLISSSPFGQKNDKAEHKGTANQKERLQIHLNAKLNWALFRHSVRGTRALPKIYILTTRAWSLAAAYSVEVSENYVMWYILEPRSQFDKAYQAGNKTPWTETFPYWEAETILASKNQIFIVLNTNSIRWSCVIASSSSQTYLNAILPRISRSIPVKRSMRLPDDQQKARHSSAPDQVITPAVRTSLGPDFWPDNHR